MADKELEDTIRLRYPRLLTAGVDYNDAQRVLRDLTRMDQWPGVWGGLADLHEGLGAAALDSGHTLTAGEAYQRAALYHHIGQSVYFADPAEKARMQGRQRAAYAKAAPHLVFPARIIDIPYDGDSFPANLRLPDGEGPFPCVLLTCGADSTKEEFHTLENEFLRRGVATCAYDGPGQSLTWTKWRLRPDWHVPVAAVVDALEVLTDIDSDRIGIWGRSYGGYAAPRAAAGESRLAACISIGGFYRLSDIWDRCPAAVHETLAFGFGNDSIAAAGKTAEQYSLEGVLGNISCPLLIVHSGQDTVCPVEESQRMIDESGDDAELIVFPEGNHVCDNIPYKARPVMADWMAEKLSA